MSDKDVVGKDKAIAVFKNIIAVLDGGLYFGSQAEVITEAKGFLNAIIKEHENGVQKESNKKGK